jgi:hypothetical protein
MGQISGKRNGYLRDEVGRVRQEKTLTFSTRKEF